MGGDAGYAERVSIRLRRRYDLRADKTATSGTVLDKKLLIERLAEMFSGNAAERVGRPAGRKRHDEADRLGRKIGLSGGMGGER